MKNIFTYEEFTSRNIGFISVEEQQILRETRVFIPGVGGMGGTAVACLARMGVEHFILADIDHFEISNLNRQLFASVDVVGEFKTEVTQRMLLDINPGIKIELYTENWIADLDNILKRTDIVINGCDDVKATIHLMRKCKEHKVPAIDAFTSPLPNVYVVGIHEKRPEEAFHFPTPHLSVDEITEEIKRHCLLKEVEHIAVHSNSLDYVDLSIAKEIMEGTRKRISFAPMVWITGCMMAYETLRIILKKTGGPGMRGIFFNPWTGKTERPKSTIVSLFRKYFVRKFLNGFSNDAKN